MNAIDFGAVQRQHDSMLPSRICIVDHDALYCHALGASLGDRGIEVCAFSDSGAFLTSVDAFHHDFYLIDLDLPGVDGLEVIRLLRRRCDAGIVVVSGRPGDAVLDDALKAGADMFLAKPAPFERTLLAIQAVARRCLATRTSLTWTLNRSDRTLNTPLGVNVALLDVDVRMLECFVDTDGAPVQRDVICARLGRDADVANQNGLHAAIYRLRRRIEQATEEVVPLQSKPRVGYHFRGRLVTA